MEAELGRLLTEVEAIQEVVGRVVLGQRKAVELLLVALLAEGHVLIEDLPGTGKTTLAKALARSLHCSFSRIQFTPDLMPSDVTGFNFFDQKERAFRFRPGPVLAQVVLADEINRAIPRTQASLLELEAMGEGQVTVDGQRILLPRPFLVLATQNPIDQGSYRRYTKWTRSLVPSARGRCASFPSSRTKRSSKRSSNTWDYGK